MAEDNPELQAALRELDIELQVCAIPWRPNKFLSIYWYFLYSYEMANGESWFRMAILLRKGKLSSIYFRHGSADGVLRYGPVYINRHSSLVDGGVRKLGISVIDLYIGTRSAAHSFYRNICHSLLPVSRKNHPCTDR